VKRHAFVRELVDAGLIRDGQTLYLCYGNRLFKEEQAEILANQNKLKYRGDGNPYSKSELATKLLFEKYKVSGTKFLRGPRFWKTEDGKLLEDLENYVRRRD